MSDFDALLKEVGDQVLVVYQSPEAVEQRLLFGQNVFRVASDGSAEVVPYEEWPDTRRES